MQVVHCELDPKAQALDVQKHKPLRSPTEEQKQSQPDHDWRNPPQLVHQTSNAEECANEAAHEHALCMAFDAVPVT